MKVRPIDPLVPRGLRLEVPEKLPQGLTRLSLGFTTRSLARRLSASLDQDFRIITTLQMSQSSNWLGPDSSQAPANSCLTRSSQEVTDSTFKLGSDETGNDASQDSLRSAEVRSETVVSSAACYSVPNLLATCALWYAITSPPASALRRALQTVTTS
jgi:hypothetical protein